MARSSTSAKAEIVDDTAKCGKCSKDVLKDGLECEICERWFHCKCEAVPSATYKALEQDKALHWYCSGCSSGVINIWKKLRERQDQLDDELRQIKEEVKGLKGGVVKIEQLEDMVKQERDRINKLEERIDEIASDRVRDEVKGLRGEVAKIVLLEDKMNKTDDRFRKMEENLEVINVDQVTSVQLRKEISQTDAKMDGIVKVRIDETLQEENEKKLRRNNVIVFGLEESEADEAATRIADDTDGMLSILKSIRCESEMKQLVRLGRKPEKVGDDEVKPRPLKVVFTDEKSKNEVLVKARTLRTTGHAHVFIVQDQTPKEREQRKVLVEERNRRKQAGEDVLIYNDRVVVRRRRVENY